MTGMTLKEFDEIVEFVNKHHRLGRIPDSDKLLTSPSGFKYHLNIAYIDSSFHIDTGKIWSVKFRSPKWEEVFTTQMDAPGGCYTLYNAIMMFLKGEWIINHVKPTLHEKI